MKKSLVVLLLLIILLALIFTKISLPLVMIGIVASFIGTLAGGGGLITLPAMMLVGIPIQTSIATNKFSSGIAALSSVFYLIHHRELHLTAIFQNISIAIIGGICGALLTASMSEAVMNGIACILLLFALLMTLKKTDWTIHPEDQQSLASKGLLQPFLIAAYDGGFGPGSSTFSILYYIRNHASYIKAVQLTRVLIFGSCTGAFLVFYQTGFIQWHYAIAMAVGSIIGSQLGLIVLPKVPLKIAKRLLIAIMLLLLIQVIIKFL